MKTYLVTGGAGFIGSCLVRQLIAETDATVVNLDKLTYAGNLTSLESVAGHERYHFHQGDIQDAALVRQLFEDYQPSALVNLAAESHVDRSIDEAKQFVLTNVVGTTALLDVAQDYWLTLAPETKQTFRFLHVSTDEVFGSLGPNWGVFTKKAGTCRVHLTRRRRLRVITLCVLAIILMGCRL